MKMALKTLGSCYLVVLALCVAVNGQWWMLGVNDLSLQVVPEDPSDVDCNSLGLTDWQKEYCQYAPELLSVIAYGTRLGILECQSIFSGSRWNCTTFYGENLFGAFVNTVTRESAFIQAMLSSAAARTIAQACKDEDRTLRNCTCKQEGLSGKDADGNFIVYDCSTNPASGNQLMRKFLFPPGSSSDTGSLDSQIERHNDEFGLELNNNEQKLEKVKVCRCHGNSGSCSLQTCYFEPPSINQMGVYLRSSFEIALKTILNEDEEIELDLSSNSYHGDIEEELWYKSDSPDFCDPNPSLGVLGTKGRECDLEVTSNRSCSALCCDRGTQKVVVLETREECYFEYCCQYICKETDPVEVDYYYCK